ARTGEVAWLIANADELGFYRTSLEGRARDRFLAAARTRLSPVEQMGFLEDQWALVDAGYAPITGYLEALDVFADADDHNVLRRVVERLAHVDLILEDGGSAGAREAFRAF